MIDEIKIKSTQKEEYIDITSRIASAMQRQKRVNGLLHLFVPHTTAAITINENADPDVMRDIGKGLAEIVPTSGFRHSEGNSPAHIKSSLIGASLTVNIENKELCLGTWQGVYFCEFDGPRERKVWITFHA
ncbi:MAG: secondary thiamine-phosphate synthase enzyme YjbQ [Candidatus Omnitrophica bacterium]|nr:secondary thiamine-phosphate synthase enzyme YjbQ [Candidatus Omnitrophota bacterium]